MEDIPGYQGLYAVTQDGQIWSHKTGKFLKTMTDRLGYKFVHLCKEHKQYGKKIHRLVAITYIPNPEAKRTVNHKNGIKADNRVENLEWATHSENKKHAWNTGLQKATEKVRKTAAKVCAINNILKRKLTMEQANQIRFLYKAGKYNQSELSRMFKIARYSIVKIIKNEYYIETI